MGHGLMINKILVACYSTLLTFYGKVMAFLQEESRIQRILESFHSEIPEIVGNFNGHADKLSKMMEVETLVTVKKILDQQTEEFGTCTTGKILSGAVVEQTIPSSISSLLLTHAIS